MAPAPVIDNQVYLEKSDIKGRFISIAGVLSDGIYVWVEVPKPYRIEMIRIENK